MPVGQRNACTAFHDNFLADPAAMGKRQADAQKWALAAKKASGDTTKLAPPPRDAAWHALQGTRPQPSRYRPSTAACADIRIVSASPSSSFTHHNFRDVRDKDSDEALPAPSRAHSAFAPGISSDGCHAFPDPTSGGHSDPLPDLKLLHIDEVALQPGDDESNFNDDEDYDYGSVRDPHRD